MSSPVSHITVVPEDQLILLDFVPLRFPFEAPPAMHAMQWHLGSGHIEWKDDYNHPLTLQDYEDDVAPFVALWEAEYARLQSLSLLPEPEILPPDHVEQEV